MSYSDTKFIEIIQSSLRNFKRKSDRLYNFSCFYCGDSEKNPRKARAYLIQKDGKYHYYCHNCNKSISFKWFLRDFDYSLFQEYIKDTLVPDQIQPKINADTFKQIKVVPNILSYLQKVESVDNAKQFLLKRKIPKKWFKELFYTPEFQTFTNKIIPKKFEKEIPDPRIVIPFYDNVGKLFGFQGRALDNSGVRYYTIMINEGEHKFWNLNKVDMGRRYYLTEGPFDAMFLDNAIAICGSDLKSGMRFLNNPTNVVLVYDNEPRNKDIVHQYEKAIEDNYHICIWPGDILEKDINDMVLAGRTPAEVQHIIDENSFGGLKAKLKFEEWRKV